MIPFHQLTLEVAIIHHKLYFNPSQVIENNESICFTADIIWRWNLCNISWGIFFLLPLYGSNFYNCLYIRKPQQLGVWLYPYSYLNVIMFPPYFNYHHCNSFQVTTLDIVRIAKFVLACFFKKRKRKKKKRNNSHIF